ncbi:MAG TPA: hypothetical protein VF173_25995 [Thermoanaerobaculia bacterium]|nr:hypothetical protein [Thermoanaerobaculia bacterium]
MGADRNCAAGERGHVTCDGVTTTCSAPCPPCSITALCGSGTPVSCSGNNCSGADRDCDALEQGHVTCDGTTTWCSSPVCCDCFSDEMACADLCNPCSYRFTCNSSSCSESCSCTFCQEQQ